LQTLIAQSGISDSIYLLGYIPYQDLPGLYAAATALVFPSLFEGFGMPVLEAMACGCPVICSNTTSLPELVGEAAILIDPLNVAQIAEAIYNVLNFASLREAMKDKGLRQVQNFSWIRAAQQTVEVYQSVL
jgi:glycosyltransferase involved in cell wall biosynthesis